MAAETAFHAEPWECKHVEHPRTHRRTMLHCARPTPILTPGDPRGWDGKRTWKNEEGAFSLPRRQVGELLKKKAPNHHHLPEGAALRLARGMPLSRSLIPFPSL